MLTTFDRYLLRRFAHTCLVCVATALGVFFVFDAFNNVDEFLKASDRGDWWPVVRRMGTYYACRSALFLGMIGPILAVMAVMLVLVQVQRRSELHPVLAAGVPLYRVVAPLLFGVIVVNGLLVANQEFLLPSIAHRLQSSRSRGVAGGVPVGVVPDFASNVLVSGAKLFPGESRVEQAEFVLPVPEITERLTTLRAERAYYLDQGPNRPAGWLLTGVRPRWDELALTPRGRRLVRRDEREDHLFIVSGVRPDQLAKTAASTRLLSTSDLLRRIKSPSLGAGSVHAQVLAIHQRLTRPFLNIFAVVLAVPFVVRRESRGPLLDLAVGGTVLLAVLGFAEGCGYLAGVHVLRPDLAAWLPLVACAGLATWWARIAQS